MVHIASLAPGSPDLQLNSPPVIVAQMDYQDRPAQRLSLDPAGLQQRPRSALPGLRRVEIRSRCRRLGRERQPAANPRQVGSACAWPREVVGG